jgi:hypothetical protein
MRWSIIHLKLDQIHFISSKIVLLCTIKQITPTMGEQFKTTRITKIPNKTKKDIIRTHSPFLLRSLSTWPIYFTVCTFTVMIRSIQMFTNSLRFFFCFVLFLISNLGATRSFFFFKINVSIFPSLLHSHHHPPI